MNAKLLRLAARLALLAPILIAGEARGDALPPTALLRVHASFYGGGHGVTFWDQDFFVGRNRATTAVLTKNYQTSPIPLGWVTSQIAAVAGAGAMQALSEALVADHVIAQRGACSVTDTVGPISGSFEITWYGAFRRAVFTIEFNGTEAPPPCSDDVLHLYRAIQTFAASTGAPGLGPTLQ